MIHQFNMLNSLCQILDLTPDERDKLRNWISDHVIQFNCKRTFSSLERELSSIDLTREAERFNSAMIVHNLVQQKMFMVEQEPSIQPGLEITHSILVFKP